MTVEASASVDRPAGHPVFGTPAPHVARIDFTGAERANCLGPDDLAAIERHLDTAEGDSSLHVLVIASQGRLFSAGFDLDVLAARGAGDRGGLANDFERAVDRIERSRLITIAAVNGAALGGATDLVLACDLCVGSSLASMTMPAARFGFPLYAGLLRRYVSRLGINRAKRLVLTAETIDADEMQAMGILTQRVAPDEVDARAMQLAIDIAAMPPVPLSAMKAAMNATQFDPTITTAMRALLEAATDGPAIAARVAEALDARRRGRKGAA